MSQEPPEDGERESRPSPPADQSRPYNPYAQPPPPGPSATQPVWQGHQAPREGHPGSPGPTGQGKPGRTWVAAVLVVLFLVVAAVVITTAVLVTDGDDDQTISIVDIEAGQCLDSDDLDDEGEVGTIEEADCDDEHDAEAFATLALKSDETIPEVAARCVQELDGLGRTWSSLDDEGIEIRPLVAGDAAGDEVVCFIRHRDGKPLTGSEFDFE